MKNNVVIKHSLEEYNKKYRNLRHKLLKLSKKDVEDFDKRNHVGIKNYLLNDRKWALIGDTYYEIPKAPRWTWFRNLSAGVQVLTGVLAVGVVATAVAVPLVLLNQVEPDISIDLPELVTWSNKHYDSEGNACLTIKGKDGNQIQSLELSIENYKCIENTDFTYDVNSGDLVVKKACIDAHPGKINIKPIFKEETEEDKFYKVYKKASDAFQKSTYVYDAEDITYTYNGEAKTITGVTYSTTSSGARNATAAADINVELGGGDQVTYFDDEDKGIKSTVSMLKGKGATFTFTSDAATGECGIAYKNAEMSSGVFVNGSYKFNKNGYITEMKSSVNGSAENIQTLTYNGEPHESWETLADIDAAKAFVTSTYASKTAATMQSIDVTYDGTNSTSSGATTVNSNMKTYFGSDYTDNSLYYSGNRTSASLGTYFGKMQTDYEPIVTATFLDNLESEMSPMGGELVYKKKGSEFYIKGTINFSGSGITFKSEAEYYYNSNGQCISYYNDYYYEESYKCVYVEDCKFNY